MLNTEPYFWQEYRTASGLWVKTVLLCEIKSGERVSAQIAERAALFERITKRSVEYVFMSHLPAGATDGIEINGIMLVMAEEWMPGNYIGLWSKGFLSSGLEAKDG